MSRIKVAASFTALAVFIGVLTAGSAASQTTTKLCVNKTKGTVRVITGVACRSGETLVKVVAGTIAGPQGPKGDPGTNGLTISISFNESCCLIDISDLSIVYPLFPKYVFNCCGHSIIFSLIKVLFVLTMGLFIILTIFRIIFLDCFNN